MGTSPSNGPLPAPLIPPSIVEVSPMLSPEGRCLASFFSHVSYVILPRCYEAERGHLEWLLLGAKGSSHHGRMTQALCSGCSSSLGSFILSCLDSFVVVSLDVFLVGCRPATNLGDRRSSAVGGLQGPRTSFHGHAAFSKAVGAAEPLDGPKGSLVDLCEHLHRVKVLFAKVSGRGHLVLPWFGTWVGYPGNPLGDVRLSGRGARKMPSRTCLIDQEVEVQFHRVL